MPTAAEQAIIVIFTNNLYYNKIFYSMKKSIYSVSLSLMTAVFISLVSCSGDDDISDKDFNPENEKMVGTKWTATNWDYGIGDDWVSTIEEQCDIYFYSNSEGLIYYDREDSDSDFGSSRERKVAHFTYNVRGNNIELDYITDQILNIKFLELNQNTLSATNVEFTKSQMNSSDQTLIATLHGTTQHCQWYHDLTGTLYIVGEGDMADYTAYNDTPWGRNKLMTSFVTVEEGVTSIGAYAFASASVTDADLPRTSLQRINHHAFSNATISDIYLSSNITEIGDEAFYDCTYLKDIYVPDNIEHIGNFAFANCRNASLLNTKRLKRIGEHAFTGCKVSRFTESEVLEEVGMGAFTDLDIDELILPNSLKTIGHLSFNGNFNEIHIGTGLTNVTGTPFYPYKTGKMYINLGVPLQLTNRFLDPASGWTLYVPEGSKEAYSNAKYWNEFKNIVEDATLESGNGNPDESGDGDENEDEDGSENENITIPSTYSNNGNTYKWIKVESPTLPTFYIMQTELNPNSHFRVGKDGDIGILNASGDYAVIKTEFRNFLEKIKEVTGIDMRLPTREEWMYAASGGKYSKGYTYSGSDDIDQVAWYKENSQNSLHDFAEKEPNELGIYDMSGNYGELCNDNANDPANVDGRICGGCYSDAATNCKVTSYKEGSTSGKIPGTNIKEKNAFDIRKIAVRLVFTAPKDL